MHPAKFVSFLLSSTLIFSIQACHPDEPDPDHVPKVTTLPAIIVNPIHVTLQGEVTDKGTADVTSRGFCWALTSEPTMNDSMSQDGLGLGEFTHDLTALTNSIYFFRAYAINSAGTAYGAVLNFRIADEFIKIKHNKDFPPDDYHTYQMSFTIDVEGDNVNDFQFNRYISHPLGGPWYTYYSINALGGGYQINSITSLDTTFRNRFTYTLEGSRWGKKVALLDTIITSCRRNNYSDNIIDTRTTVRLKTFDENGWGDASGEWTGQEIRFHDSGGVSMNTNRKENADTIWLSTIKSVTDCHPYASTYYIRIRKLINGLEKYGWIKFDYGCVPSESVMQK